MWQQRRELRLPRWPGVRRKHQHVQAGLLGWPVVRRHLHLRGVQDMLWGEDIAQLEVHGMQLCALSISVGSVGHAHIEDTPTAHALPVCCSRCAAKAPARPALRRPPTF